MALRWADISTWLCKMQDKGDLELDEKSNVHILHIASSDKPVLYLRSLKEGWNNGEGKPLTQENLSHLTEQERREAAEAVQALKRITARNEEDEGE